MASVKFNNVWKKYGDVEAVKDASFEIKDKEFFSILGPSGCGKSTTLRMIAGLEHISSGTIEIDGEIVNDVDPYKRDIAMVFESYALYPHKTVFENMAYPLRNQKVNEKEIQERVQKAAKALQISDLLERWPRQLSGGQKQRVAIGRTIVRQPKVFLLDEPIGHLDAKLRTHMRGELKRLHRDLNATMVYVTHDQLEAMTMADRILVFDAGVIQQIGTPNEVFNQPVNKFVAGFLGDPPMNFIPCTLRKKGDTYTTSHSNFTLDLPEVVVEKLKGKNIPNELDVEIGIRPESFVLSPEPSNGSNIEGKIYVTEPLGEDMIIDISIGHQRVKAKALIGYDWQVDQPVHMNFKYEKLHIFDRETGVNLTV